MELEKILFQIGIQSKEGLVTPVILDYYQFKSYGFDDEVIINGLQRKYGVSTMHRDL